MRVYVKTLKGTNFEINVEPHHTIADVKKNIENVQGISVYPAEQQLLIYQGKILENETTILDNQVADDSFFVIMLSKTKASTSGASNPKILSATQLIVTSGASSSNVSPATQTPSLSPFTPDAPIPQLEAPPAAPRRTYPYERTASNLVGGNNFEKMVQDITEMDRGTWDRDIVVRTVHAAFYNPERAVEYLYSGIPEQDGTPLLVAHAPSAARSTNQATPASQPVNAAPIPSAGGPNTNPLDLFSQDQPSNMVSENAAAGASNLDFLHDSPEFQVFQAMVQADPRTLQPMLQELGRRCPQIMRLIQEHQFDFLRLINEPIDGNLLGNAEDFFDSQTVQVAPEEAEAIARLEAMGFSRWLVYQVFIACNRNEELAANHHLDFTPEFSED